MQIYGYDSQQDYSNLVIADRYIVKDKIGEGSQGKVYNCVD